MNKLSNLLGCCVVLVFLTMSPAIAKNSGNQGNSNGQGNSDSQKGNSKNKNNAQEMHYAGISQKDAKKYAKQYKFYGYKPLPPGIRKNMARGKPIPPGLAYNRVPAPYLATLPRYNGYEWRGYGSDLVLVSIVSNVIADVIVDALN